MNDLDWEAEHVRFMTVAYARTVASAKRAFWGWHSRKRDDAIQECLAKMWDQWSRLLLRGRDPEPMLRGLIKFAILWVRYDRRIGGSAPMPDVYDYRAGFTQQHLNGQGWAYPSDPSDAGNGWINWDVHKGDDPSDLAAALERCRILLAQWYDL
jgi:hypothetical protein